MQELADKFHTLEKEVENLLVMGEEVSDISSKEGQESISEIIETVGVVMDEINELEKEYNKKAKELKSK